MVKVDSKKFAEFISVATLNKKFESAVLQFKTDGLHINGKSQDNTLMNLIMMPKESFEQYDIENKKVGIKDVNMFINLLKSFEGTINLNITDELLVVFNDKKKASIKTANTMYLDDYNMNEVPEKLVNMFDAGCSVNNSIFLSAKKNVGFVGADELFIRFKDNKLTITVGDDNADKIEETENVKYNVNTLCSFNTELFSSAVSVLDRQEEIGVSMPKQNEPIQFTLKTDYFVSKIILAPNSNIETGENNEQQDNQSSEELSTEQSESDDLL